MKAYLISISAVFLIIICVVQAQTAILETTETLAKKSGCFKCHGGVDDKKRAIAPSFADMATKYTRDSMSTEVLFQRIKKGSKGHWTEVTRGVPMPPYGGRLSDEQIRSLVEWMVQR